MNVFVFAILLMVTNFFNANYYGTPVIPITLLMCCIFFYALLLHNILDNGIIIRAIYGMAVGCIMMSILFVLGIGIEFSDDSRLLMFGENSNALGVYMSLGATIIFCNWILRDDLKMKGFRYLWIVAYIPIAILLFATGSRTSFLSFILTFIICVFGFRPKQVRRKLIVAMFSIILGFVMYNVLLNSEFVILQRLLETAEDGNLSGRDVIWAKLWPYVEKHILLGVGETGYVEISREALGAAMVPGGTTYGYSPHNVLLELILYTGVWGLILFLWFWLKNFHCALVAYRASSKILPILLIVPIVGCILSGQILTAKWAYLIYAYVIATGTKNKGYPLCKNVI